MEGKIAKPSDMRETVVFTSMDSVSSPYSYGDVVERGAELLDYNPESIPVLEDPGSLNKDIPVIDFQEPQDELIEMVEDVLEADVSEVQKASQLASASIDALKNSDFTGPTDYLLTGSIYDEFEFHEDEGLAVVTDIPQYFYERPVGEKDFHMVEMEEGKTRLGIFSDDEIALAWQVGEIASDYELPPGFADTYNETLSYYCLQRQL